MIVSATVMSPCKGCTKRSVGCHTACKEYAEYKDTLEANRAKIAAQNAEQNFNYAVKKEVVKRFKKRRKGDDR